MPTSTPALPLVVSHTSPRISRGHAPFTLDDLAAALRGKPRDSVFYVETADGLCPVIAVMPTQNRAGANDPAASTADTVGFVLRSSAATDRTVPQPHCSKAEDHYRAVLQAIARGRTDGSRARAGTEAQAMARKVLIDMGDDWTKQGSSLPG